MITSSLVTAGGAQVHPTLDGLVIEATEAGRQAPVNCEDSRSEPLN
jgi:hypothetical protein